MIKRINKKTLFNMEKVISILQVIILLYCISLQFIPRMKYWFPVLQCLPAVEGNIAVIFFQVDATLLTLSIALVALISSFISKSYMGISYSDYYLNKRPKIYNQTMIFFLSFLYLVIGAISILLNWCYILPGIFFCEVLLILFSYISIYSVFRGTHYVRDEIAVYSKNKQLCKQTKDEAQL